MVNRLSPREAMYYFLDPSGATSHLGALLVFGPDRRSRSGRSSTARGGGAPKSEPVSGPDYPALVSLVENRLQLAPRYRQVVRSVSLGLARPVWVDDPDFDINFHIRRSGLPQPGTMAALADLISRVMSRPLDRSRPLWEMYLIEGLPDGGFAVLTKTHRCLVDDFSGPEISQVICDDGPTVRAFDEDLWMPRHLPGSTALVIGAIAEAVSRPGEFVESMVTGNGVVGTARSMIGSVVRRAGDLIRDVTDAAPDSPLNTPGSSSQIFAVASVPRRGCAKIAEHHGCTVHDVELAIITGVIRRWLLSYDVAATITDTVRVEIPLATRDPGVGRLDDEPGWVDVGAPGFVTDLPVGEDNPTVRLAQVAGLADRYAQSARRVTPGPSPILGDLGMVPFPELSSWAFRSLGNRGYNVPVSLFTAPVPDRYVLGRKVSEIYPVPGLIAGHALAIGVVEYRGRLRFGFIADRGVIGDLPALADYVGEAYDELAGAG
ncbi:DUF1298 domain-containing protein [Gordonia desulfuricans]|uniref:diacylglycerol O-acyltransferase n=1 Tax=Gordonia desulfuricans TaxID=89051 RepID=A0A7K3LSK1_9ACTN|nr:MULTISPECIES: wax ester/triacylglycerol synthase domain-containing protein [Gordonia]NDK91264.1 DUF1298 domain-containing protein [Gordonia desulfuricans]WLP89785.1 wax ester/triacylglycerol synthase family O-acyltransferase [Gordonia sp. NB41Y]